jgi:hypothetical protein
MIYKNLSNEFPVQNGMKQGAASSPLCYRLCLREGPRIKHFVQMNFKIDRHVVPREIINQ